MQRIIVKNFGPLKDIDLEIKDYMIFLGPQASGKSTLAKLIYFGTKLLEYTYKFFVSRELVSIDYEININGLSNYLRTELFTLIDKNNQEFELSFEFNDSKYFKIISTSEKEYLETDSKTNTILINIINDITLTDSESNQDLFIKYYQELESNIKRNLYHIFGDIKQVYFLPDNRSSFSFSSFTFESKPLFSDSINESIPLKFRNEINLIRKHFNNGFDGFEYLVRNRTNFDSEQKLNLCRILEKRILKGSFKSGENDQILLENAISINLSSSSSGQREAIWLIIFLCDKILLNKRSIYTIIEEPEAHLFPEAQKDITYLISLLANQEGNQVIITTHSHYILGALNILINAHRIGQTNPEEVEKIVPRELWVDKNRIFAGFLENGIIKDIYDDEAEMIKIQQLNAVAGEINKDFDRLLDLEFANENV